MIKRNGIYIINDGQVVDETYRSRDEYHQYSTPEIMRGKSFRYKDDWVADTWYYNDEYNQEYITYKGCLFICLETHVSSDATQPVVVVNGDITTGEDSTYWKFLISSVKGESAYDQAVEGGYTGTKDEFMYALAHIHEWGAVIEDIVLLEPPGDIEGVVPFIADGAIVDGSGNDIAGQFSDIQLELDTKVDKVPGWDLSNVYFEENSTWSGEDPTTAFATKKFVDERLNAWGTYTGHDNDHVNINVSEEKIISAEINQGSLTEDLFSSDFIRKFGDYISEGDPRLADARPASDVYPWAKAPTKPKYTASEVGALSTATYIPLNLSDLNNDVGYILPTVDDLYYYYRKDETYTARKIDELIEESKGTVSPEQLEVIVDTVTDIVVQEIPENTSELVNDSGFITKSVSDLDNYPADAEVQAMIDSSGFVNEDTESLLNYYTKTATDTILVDFVDKDVDDLVNYYNKADSDLLLDDKLDVNAPVLDTFATNVELTTGLAGKLDSDDPVLDTFITDDTTGLVNYYSKTEVDNLTTDFITDNTSTLVNYYTKGAVDTLTADYITSDVDNLTNYYTETEVNSLTSDFITNTVDDLVNYYDKAAIDATVGGCVSTDTTALVNYYTKTAVDTITADFIDKDVSDLTNYYTETEVDTLTSDFIDNTVADLVNYYDKTEIDTMTDDFITDNTSTLVNYYNKTAIDTMTAGFIEKDVADLDNYYTSTEVDTLTSGFIDKNVSDLTNYYTETEVNTLTSGFIEKDVADLDNYYTTTEIDATINALNTSVAGKLDSSVAATTYVPQLGYVAYSDAEKTKLAGIEAGAEVNPTTLPNPQNLSINGVLYDGSVYKEVEISTAWEDISNKPTFATVATSGSYTDLSDKPTIPSVTGLASEEYVDDSITNHNGDATAHAYIQGEVAKKVDKVSGMGLSSNDYTTADKDKLADLENFDPTTLDVKFDEKADQTALTAEVTNRLNGDSTLDAKIDANKTELEADIEAVRTSIPSITGLATTEQLNTGLALKQDLLTAAQLANIAAVPDKVDKVSGKSLSTNDYVTEDKDKLAGIESGAEVNVNYIAGDNVTFQVAGNDVTINADQPSVISVHNALSGRDIADTHPMSAITGLNSNIQQIQNSLSTVDTKIDDQLALVYEQLTLAYTNAVAYPIDGHAYNAQNTWITWDNKIYRCVNDTIWTGVITSDWALEYYTRAETDAQILSKVQAALAGEFPLQMRPDANYGVYTTVADAPITDNDPGYLIVVTDPIENGIYIWGINPFDPQGFEWVEFVKMEVITEESLQTTFNGVKDDLKTQMGAIQVYVDSHINSEVGSRQAQFNGIDTRTTALEANALTIADAGINGTVFRGTQAEFDVDPNRFLYYLAIIVE